MDLKCTGATWSGRKITAEALANAFSRYAKGSLADIGCGDKPYRELLKPYVTKHIGIDHEGTIHDTANIDLFGTAYDIPVEDEYFDTVICTAVLEHLEEPDKAIKETNRVLKPDCYAIYVAPLFYKIHEEPRDFFRYTEFGLRYLFEKNGFEITELRPLSGFWVTFGLELVNYVMDSNLRKVGGKLNPFWWVIPIIVVIIQSICYQLNKVDSATDFTWAYLVVAKKNRSTNS
jgi:ubiquinone/menaquinone biosynthesis C-methylase UbiE